MVSAKACPGAWPGARLLYPNKMPITAVHLLNTDMLPTFEQHKAQVTAILSDKGREFCGRPDRHPYKLFLQFNAAFRPPAVWTDNPATPRA